MNDTKTKKSVYTLFFAVLLLLFIAGAFAALSAPDKSAYAETGQTNTAAFTPTKFTTTFSNNSYTITGFDTSDNAWTSATAEQKQNIAIVIPAVYNDSTNGEHPVVAIAAAAFDMNTKGSTGEVYYGCKFTSLDLSNASNLTTIKDNAFNRCSGLTGALTIPNSVTTIGNYAFYGCMGFKDTLTLPINESFTWIGRSAFYNCSGFTGPLTIPDSVTRIGEYAFHGCSGFNDKLTLPTNDAFTAIGEDAFRSCSGLTGTLTIPNSVMTIEGSAFSGCSGFTGVLTIPNSVTTIGRSAFNGCTGFTGPLTIPNSVTTIGSSAFYFCSGFTGALTIPNSVTTIGSSAFYGCSGFNGKLTLPTNDSFTAIETSAFSECSGFTGALTIPNSVTTIWSFAFAYCDRFNDKLTLPTNDSFTWIGDSAFRSCSGFTGALTIPNSVTTIGDFAFYECGGFNDKLTLPTNDSFTMIGESTFEWCNGFTGALTIPNSVTTIEDSAFLFCSGFKTVYLPNAASGTTYGTYAFGYNSAYPVIAPSKELYNTYKASGHNLAGYSSLTYELSVTYDANGGTVTGGNTETKLFHYSIKMEKNADGVWAENANYKLPTASKTNYAFAGWNSQSDGKGTYWAQSLLTSSINTETPLTYYAQFSENLSGITVTGTPNKTQYTAFEQFDATGLSVTANYESGTSKNITGYTVKYTGSNTSLRCGDISVTIYYTENGVEKTATVSGLTVNKMKLTAPTVYGTYTYRGEMQTVMLSNVSDEYMTITNNTRTEAGEQIVTVTLIDSTNYEWEDGSSAPLSLKWTIGKLRVIVPTADTTQFSYTGQQQTYTVASSEYYSVSGNMRTNAGEQSVTVALTDKTNTEWEDGGTDDITFAFKIAKASYNMSGVTFADVTVKEDGAAHTLTVTGLPEGVSAAYTGTNGYTSHGAKEAGVYEVTATFSVADAANYEIPAAMTATLTINIPEITGGGVTDEGDAEIIIGGGDDGMKPGTALVVEEKPVDEYKDANIVIADEKYAVMQASDIMLTFDGTAVQPDGTVTVKMLIKPDLRGYNDLKVISFAQDGSTQDMNAVRDGNYMVFDATSLSVYALVAPQSLLPAPEQQGLGGGAIFGIVFAVLIVLLILVFFAFFFFRKDKAVGLKQYCVALGNTCAAAVKGWGKKFKGLFLNNNAKDDTANEKSETSEGIAETVTEKQAEQSVDASETESDDDER